MIRNRNPLSGYGLVVQHIKSLRNIKVNNYPKFQDIPIVIGIESNFGNEHYTIANHVMESKLKNVIILKEDKGMIGIRTGKTVPKQTMVDYGNEKIRNSKILFSNMLVTNSEHVSMKKMTPEEITGELIKQLLSFEKRYEYGLDNEKPPRIIFSGKGSNRFDDLVMAFLLNLQTRRLFLNDTGKRYSRWRERAALGFNLEF